MRCFPCRLSHLLLVAPCLVAIACQTTGAGPVDPGGPIPTGTIAPADLVYAGAFRLPDASGGSSWEWGGDALAYCPVGDPSGPADGFPGSLYGVGHDWDKQITEIAVPAPVVSAARAVADLPTATTLRPFTDVRRGVGQLERFQEIPRVGMAYLPAQGGQASAKLHLCWGQHFQESEDLQVPSHMWCEPDLTGSQGAWRVGDRSFYSVNDYMFEIPANWAAAHASGRRLATGRFRDGGWGGQGPGLFAIAPWESGDPPPDGAVLPDTPLLLYSSTAFEEPVHTMADYHHADEWTGGSWLTTEDSAAVVFVGTKGTGDCWYGLPDGTVWPDEPPYPEDPANQRGWWSSGFIAQMLFFDPADLAQVAEGRAATWTPQPYATLDLDSALFRPRGGQEKTHLAACAYDRARGLLYFLEPFADGDKPIVHVWRLG